jgi:hypothetical protein
LDNKDSERQQSNSGDARSQEESKSKDAQNEENNEQLSQGYVIPSKDDSDDGGKYF